MSDEKPKQFPSMKQENINAKTNIQAGRDVTIHNAPPPAPNTEGPRTITPEGETEMIRLLRPHAGRSLYLTEYNEPEVLRFSRQIQNIFATSGWNVVTANVGSTNVNAYGLVCGVLNPDHPPAAAEAIRLAFKKVNISIPFEGMERMWPGSFASEAKQRGALFIIVGRKP